MTNPMSLRNLSPSPMRGRLCQLRPIIPEDHRILYSIAIADQVNFRWRYRGAVPPFEAFIAGLHADVLSQFVVCGLGDPRPAGLVVTYTADMNNGTTFLGAVMTPETIGSSIGIEATCLFVRHIFETWNIRRIYMEVVEYNMPFFQSGEGSLFTIEGCQKERYYFADKFWDNFLLTIEKEQVRDFLDRIL